MSRRSSLALMVLILLGALFLRLYSLGDIPYGLTHDETYNALDAQEILKGHLAIFFPADQGRLPVPLYAQAASVALFGSTPFALRLPAALVGFLTVLSLFFLAQELEQDPQHRKVFPLLVAAAAAFTFWPLSFSRVGTHPIFLPLFEIWTLYFLLRGLHANAEPFFLLAGLLLGASLYSYGAAYFLPLTVILVFATTFAFRRYRKPWRQRATQMALIVGVAGIVFLPLGLYFFAHPLEVAQRPSQLLLASQKGSATSLLTALLQQSWQAIAVFFLPYPVDSPINGGGPLPELAPRILLLLGIGYGLGSRWGLGTLTIVITFATMLMPAVLFFHGAPNTSRLVGTMVPLSLLLGYGMYALVAAADALVLRLLKNRRLSWGAPLQEVLIVGLALLLALPAGHRYFVVWPGEEDTYGTFATDFTVAGRLLRGWLATKNGSPDVGLVMVGGNADDVRIITFMTENRVPMQTFKPNQYLLFPAEISSPVLYVISHRAHEAQNAMASLFAPYRLEAPPFAGSQYLGGLYLLPPQAYASLSRRDPLAYFGNGVHLDSYTYPPSLRPGESALVTLHWTVADNTRSGVDHRDRFFNHLIDKEGKHIAGIDGIGHERPQWRQGDHVILWLQLEVPTEAPPGEYWIETGMYDLGSMKRVTIEGIDTSGPLERLRLGPVVLLP